MIRTGATIALALLVMHSSASSAAAQPATRPGRNILMMVEVTISRHLGDKRPSSTPYSLSVVPTLRSSLRMGGEVPVPTVTFVPATKDDEKTSTPRTSFGYRPVGTNIDVSADTPVDDKYVFTITIDESSIYAPEALPPASKATGAPSFRNFKSSNSLAMRDGETLEYVMATDRISGEVYRVSVKLTVVK